MLKRVSMERKAYLKEREDIDESGVMGQKQKIVKTRDRGSKTNFSLVTVNDIFTSLAIQR
jgi:hypothetical protein